MLVFGLSACEKDDICVGGESLTPNVVINLLDRLDPEVLKPAARIAVIANGFNDTLFFKSTAKVELPLQINTNETTWDLVLYIPTANDTVYRKDQLKFTYTPEAMYVSKACGYKTIFHEFNAIKTTSASADTWIQSINRLTNELTTTDNAHLQIYY